MILPPARCYCPVWLGDPGRRLLRSALLLLAAAGSAVGQPAAKKDLAEMSLEDLLNIEVTSVARREQKLSQSASAIYVITGEDIRRSGVTTLPDALRMAPGVQVMQMDGVKWAVGIRGFNGRFSNKLLVMIDGRSLYSPAFGGVYWEASEAPLEDIERIEVIRGPGATLWGSNAVAGVINIITKPARQTQGMQLTAGGGNQEGALGSARFGGEAGSDVQYRFYTKYDSRSGLLRPSGERANDNSLKSQGGFRIDWQPSERDEILLSGDAYEGEGGERYRVLFRGPPYSLETPYRTSYSGANLLARWTHTHADGSITQFQSYFDRINRDNLLEAHSGFNLGDAEVQHQRDFSRQHVVFGAGYRISRDNMQPDWFATFDPVQRTQQRVNLFVQDEFSLLPDKLLLTVGSKFEDNTFASWEAQPSASLLWNINDRNTAWLSTARSDKLPSRVEHDLTADAFVAPGPEGSIVVGRILGSELVRPEKQTSLEGGYRLSPRPRLSFDLAAFYNKYDSLAIPVAGPPVFVGGVPPTTLLPLTFASVGSANVYGAELAAAWSPLEAGRLRLSYSWLRGGIDTTSAVAGPGHQCYAQWFWNLPGHLEWDSSYRFSDAFSTVRAYHRVDTRLGWRPSPRWAFSIAAQQLLDNQHLESPSLFALPNEVGRSVYGKLTLDF
jgi:iron complex outermembrane recepter protein